MLSGELSHETNTFNKTVTELSNFEAEVYLEGEEGILVARRGTKTSIGGVIEAADELYHWSLSVNLVCSANPTGTVSSHCFEHTVERLLLPLTRQSFDGVLLCLHGAMVSETFPDAEGEILRRARVLVGPHVPIVVTLDLHANVTAQMSTMANCLLACRTYPHVDFYETSLRAASVLQQAMMGAARPVSVLAKRRMLHGLDRGRTYPGSPMQTLVERGEALERNGVVLGVSVCAGFPAADFVDVGPSVTVTVDVSRLSGSKGLDQEQGLDQKQGQALAEEFMSFCWETREVTSVRLLSVDEAIRTTAALLAPRSDHHQEEVEEDEEEQQGEGEGEECASCGRAVVIAEVTDNPGSGHYGDSPALLAALVQALLPPHNLRDVAFYAIADPEAVRQSMAIGVGGSGWVELGGRQDPSCGGGPLTLYCRVIHISHGRFPAFGPVCGGAWQNLGLSVCLRVSASSFARRDALGLGPGVRDSDWLDLADEAGGRIVDVVVTSNKQQALDQAQLLDVGVNPAHKAVLALKSMNHFKAHFAPLARKDGLLFVDGGGLGSAILGKGGGLYKHVRRPIWPLDADEDLGDGTEGKDEGEAGEHV